jgi:hypothetical protein
MIHTIEVFIEMIESYFYPKAGRDEKNWRD